MKKVTAFLSTVIVLVIIVSIFSSCNNTSLDKPNVSKTELKSLQNQLAEIIAINKHITENLATFDTLDFTIFTNQEWTRLHESHHNDIIVHWPDGSTTKGIEKHIDDLAAMFVYAPDTRIKEHPIRIGQGNLTAVTGIMEGTFTKPMPIGEGKFIQPTGKTFKLPMATFGIWNDEGVMTEEYLFWDNQTYMNQLGLGK
jgi:hypothetical protein